MPEDIMPLLSTFVSTINYSPTKTNLGYIKTELTSMNGYFQYCCCPAGGEATACESNNYECTH